MSNESYSTKDIYIASTLIASGYTRYDLIKKGRVFYFNFFDEDGNIRLQADEYWSGNNLVSPKALFSAFKELKSRIYENEDKYKNTPNR
jgi:hypothetical protein